MATASEQFANQLLEELKTYSPGQQLPSDKTLAAQFNLSLRTVTRIMKDMAAKGLVSRYQGKGTFAPGNTMKQGSLAKQAHKKTTTERLAESIIGGIQRGDYRLGEALPPVKFITRQFNCASGSVTAAYRLLAKKGLATKVGKTYQVGPFRQLAQSGAKQEVYLYSETNEDLEGIFNRDIMSHAYIRMRNELSRHGYILLIETVDSLNRLIEQSVRKRQFPHALLFFRIRNQASRALVDACKAFRKQAVHHGAKAPRILFDQRALVTGGIPGFSVVYRSTISTAVARELAQFVIAKNYQSLRLYLDTTKLYDTVGGYSWHSLWPVLKMRDELLLVSPHLDISIIARPRNPSMTKKQFVDSQIKTGPPSVIESLLKTYHLTPSQLSKMVTLFGDFSKSFARDKNRKCAWVFSSDDHAAYALEWARAQRIIIPQQLAIISLEKDPVLFPLNITSVEPDWEAIGYLMAHALIGDIPVATTSRGFLRIPAIVNEGLTT